MIVGDGDVDFDDLSWLAITGSATAQRLGNRSDGHAVKRAKAV